MRKLLQMKYSYLNIFEQLTLSYLFSFISTNSKVSLKPGFHYYANAERKRTQGLAYKSNTQDARKLRKPKNKSRKKRNEITQDISKLTQDARKLRKPKINYATNASNATILRKKYASERNTQENYASQKQKTQRAARKRPCVVKRKNRPRFYFLALTQGDSQ